MADSFERATTLPATPEQIYDAWMDADGHTAMTGSPATSTPEVGGAFTAWNGFIAGEWVALERPSRIVMHWSTSVFPSGSPPSLVELRLSVADTGTNVHVVHSNIPEGQGPAYFEGWNEKYFEPMAAHFG